VRGEIFAHCEVLDEQSNEAGSQFRVRGEPERVRRLLERLGRAGALAVGSEPRDIQK
jgi:hypothetical protein